MAREAKKDPSELTVEEKLKALYSCKPCCLKSIKLRL